MSSLTRPSEWPTRVTVNSVLGVGALFVALTMIAPWGPSLPALAGIFLAAGVLTLAEVAVRLISLDETTGNHRDKMALMLQLAQRRIVATSGSLSANAWVDWNNGVVPQILADKAARGVKIELLCQFIDARTRSVIVGLQQRFPGTIRLYENPRVNPVPHGLLIDDLALRLEQPHEEMSDRRANAFLREPDIAAAVFLAAFEEYLRDAEEIGI